MSGGRFLLCRLAPAFGALTALVLVPLRSADASVANATADRLTGVSFLTENQPIAGSSGEFQRIKADGANTVSFDVWWVVPSLSSSSIAPAPSITDSDADLVGAAQEARQAGLRVTLTPKFVVGTSTWRGDYDPPDPATFFAGYQAMVDHYADLAQQAGMSRLYVGSEMIASDGYLDYWHQVIASARQHFSGPLSYEEDWREIGRFNFGDAVDVVAISAYFPLSSDPSPTLAQLEAGWRSYQGTDAFAEVADQAQRWGKPIVFGEVGYQASSYAGQSPWLATSNVVNDAGLQARAYQALLATFVGQPWWGGVTWWAWNNGQVRSPEGKPAEELIGERSVAYPTPAPAPGGSGPATLSPTPGAPDPKILPTGAPDTAVARSGAPGSDTPVFAEGSLQAAGGGMPAATVPHPPGPGQPTPSSAGLVRLRTAHDGPSAGDRLGETFVAVLALIAGLVSSARLIARSLQARQRAVGL